MHHSCGAYAFLHIISVFESLEKCHFVGIFEDASYGESECQPCDLYAHGFEEACYIHSCSVALNSGIGSHDDFAYASLSYPRKKLLYSELIGGDSIHRREESVKDMVNSVILSCSLKGGNVLGRFNNADNAAVPFIVSADRADVPFGQILTALTAVNVFLCVKEGLCEVLHSRLVHRHNMVSQPLGGLHSYAGERRKLFRQYDQRQSVMVSHQPLKQAWERYTACDLAHFSFCSSFDIVYSLVDSADDEILEHLNVLRVNSLRLDVE